VLRRREADGFEGGLINVATIGTNEAGGLMNRLPIFSGRTTISVVKAQEPSEMKSVQFANGTTQSWQTAPQDGTYRVLYTNISDDQLRQVREFFSANKSPGFWQCVTHEAILEKCYFSERQPFPGVIKHEKGGNIVDVVFGARYQ
jgi:hypothetical protein